MCIGLLHISKPISDALYAGSAEYRSSLVT